MKDDIRIGRVRKNALGSFIRIAQVAETGKERFPVLALKPEPFCADPAIAVMRFARAQGKRVDHAVAIKPVIPPAWRKLRVGAIAIQGAVQLRWNVALTTRS